MRQQIVIFACLCSALVYALPLSDNNNQDGLQLVQIPLGNNKELDILSLDEDGRLSERSKRTIGILRELFPELTKLNNGDNTIDLHALNEQLQETIRVARQAAAENSVTSNTDGGDQDPAESKSPAIDELTLDAEDADGDDRNKRFLPFGFGGSGQAQLSGGGGSGGGGAAGGAGSGNFLFDIIRLFSGSVQTPQGDERANEPAQSSDDSNQGGGGAGDGYTEGIPGPVTRLVVLANRGLANLIQDLILRVAATSERLVNFKARLITSLI